MRNLGLVVDVIRVPFGLPFTAIRASAVPERLKANGLLPKLYVPVSMYNVSPGMKFVLVPTDAIVSLGVSRLKPSFASFPAARQYTSSVVSASFTYHSVAWTQVAPSHATHTAEQIHWLFFISTISFRDRAIPHRVPID